MNTSPWHALAHALGLAVALVIVCPAGVAEACGACVCDAGAPRLVPGLTRNAPRNHRPLLVLPGRDSVDGLRVTHGDGDAVYVTPTALRTDGRDGLGGTTLDVFDMAGNATRVDGLALDGIGDIAAASYPGDDEDRGETTPTVRPSPATRVSQRGTTEAARCQVRRRMRRAVRPGRGSVSSSRSRGAVVEARSRATRPQ